MPGQLTRGVIVIHPETGDLVTLQPGDTVPAWAADLVTNPAAFAPVEPEGVPEQLLAVTPEGPKQYSANAPALPAPEVFDDGLLRITGVTGVVGVESDSDGDESSGETQGAEPPVRRAKEAPVRRA